MIAVSETSDPMGNWLRYRVPMPEVDFIRLALTRDAVTIVTRQGGGGWALAVSMAKEQLYTAVRDLSVTVHDLLPVDVMPVHAPDSDIEYVLTASASAIQINRLDRIAEPWIELELPVQSVSEVAPLAPQQGTTNELDTGYDDIYAAVMQRGLIYATRTIVREGAARRRTAVMWFVLDPEAGTGLRYGVVEDPHTFYAFPSLAVNHSGAVLLAFSTISSTSLPSAGYVFIDAAGRPSAAGTIKNGEAPIVDTQRWGDYTTTVADPRNGRDFWTIQMYATAQSTWGTWWSKISLPAGKRRSSRK